MQLIFRLLLMVFCLLPGSPAGMAQGAFKRSGQVFMTIPADQSLQIFSVKAGYNTIYLDPVGALPSGGLDAIGYRKTDDHLYGIGTSDNHLYRLGAGGSLQDLGGIDLDPSMYYLAGDVSPDGKYLYAVGSNSLGADVHLARIDLEVPGYPVLKSPLQDDGRLADIAFDPRSGSLFGYDEINNRVLSLSTGGGGVSTFPPLEAGNRLYGLYFDAFGDLYAVGSTLYGIVDGFFSIDKNSGKAKRLATGPVSMASDLASCPYSVEMRTDMNATVNLPCTDLLYSTSIINGGEDVLTGLDFQHLFPAGFRISAIETNTLNGMLDTLSVPGSIRIHQFSLAPGAMQRLHLRMHAGDLPKGNYRSQALIGGLPDRYNNVCLSDFVQAPGFEDSSILRINRFDVDSLKFEWLVCYGEQLVLESQDYGSSVQWFNGATTGTQTVQQGGIYGFYSGNTCEHIVVTHEVISASCPFTISVWHSIEPDTTFACSELVYRYLLANDSGEKRASLTLTDTLPAGFKFKELKYNSIGGQLTPNNPPGVFCLNNLTLKAGRDTVEWLVEIGDVPPGTYRNRAKLFGLPQILGPIRLSDDPATFASDSTELVVQGVMADTLFLDTVICRDRSLTLDAHNFGKHFLWDDGSEQPSKTVEESGTYHLSVNDGCTPSQIYWQVVKGPEIHILPLDPVRIHQGDSVLLQPQIWNEGQELTLQWSGTDALSLSCDRCLEPYARPLHSRVFGLKAANEFCFDSTTIGVEVDEQPRIYFPNAFSPNDDGKNDVFTLQSPDFAKIVSLEIFDRWGNIVGAVSDQQLTDNLPIWDGRHRGKWCPPGLYIWHAKIVFIDGLASTFSGELTLIR